MDSAHWHWRKTVRLEILWKSPAPLLQETCTDIIDSPCTKRQESKTSQIPLWSVWVKVLSCHETCEFESILWGILFHAPPVISGHFHFLSITFLLLTSEFLWWRVLSSFTLSVYLFLLLVLSLTLHSETVRLTQAVFLMQKTCARRVQERCPCKMKKMCAQKPRALL